MIKAFPIYQNTSGCDYHRVRLPFMCSGNYVDNAFYKDFTLETAEDYFAKSEVLVYNRAFPVDKLKYFKSCGVKTVCDIDDYWILYHEHPLYNDYNNGLTRIMIENMKLADLVTTTTERLAKLISSYNKNVFVLPNALPFGVGQFRSGKKGERFVYTGLSSHLKDVTIIDSVMNQLKTIEGLKVSLAGYKRFDRAFDKMASIFKKIKNCTLIDRLPLDNYMDCYNGAGASLIPLVNNNFNNHKSNLKILEAAAKKIPAVVSFVPPYSDDIDAPVLWVKHKTDWYKHIKALHESPAMREDYGNKLYEWAFAKYNLEYWNKVRFELYKSLLD